MEDGEGVGVHERPEWGEVDGERIDQHEFARPGDLDQGDLGPIGAFAVKLRVEGVPGLNEQLLDDRRELGFGVDETMRSHGFRRRLPTPGSKEPGELCATTLPSWALLDAGERAGPRLAGQSRSLEAACGTHRSETLAPTW